jgi:hypothetical protein
LILNFPSLSSFPFSISPSLPLRLSFLFVLSFLPSFGFYFSYLSFPTSSLFYISYSSLSPCLSFPSSSHFSPIYAFSHSISQPLSDSLNFKLCSFLNSLLLIRSDSVLKRISTSQCIIKTSSHQRTAVNHHYSMLFNFLVLLVMVTGASTLFDSNVR